MTRQTDFSVHDVIVQSAVEYSFCPQPKSYVIEGLVLRLVLLGEILGEL